MDYEGMGGIYDANDPYGMLQYAGQPYLYTNPDGSQVQVTLSGDGQLPYTQHDPNGSMWAAQPGTDYYDNLRSRKRRGTVQGAAEIAALVGGGAALGGVLGGASAGTGAGTAAATATDSYAGLASGGAFGASGIPWAAAPAASGAAGIAAGLPAAAALPSAASIAAGAGAAGAGALGAGALGAASAAGGGGMFGNLGLGSWMTLGSLGLQALQGNKDITTTNSNSPPAYLAPYLADAAGQAYNLYGQGNYISPVQQAAVDYGTNVLTGNYLSSNPYLDATFNKAAGAVTNAVQSNFGAAGRNVRGADAAGLATDKYSELATQIYGGNYQAERDRQQQLIPLANSLGQVTDPGAGLDQYIARLRNVGGGYGSSTSTTPTESDWLSGLAGLGLVLAGRGG